MYYNALKVLLIIRVSQNIYHFYVFLLFLSGWIYCHVSVLIVCADVCPFLFIPCYVTIS